MKATCVMGLSVSMQKTKYMEIKKKNNNNNNNNNNAKMLNIYDQEHERVKEFKYPGKSRLEENVITTANNYD